MNQATGTLAVKPDIMGNRIDICLAGDDLGVTTEEVIRHLGSPDLRSRTRERIWHKDSVTVQGVPAVRLWFGEPYYSFFELDLRDALDKFSDERRLAPCP